MSIREVLEADHIEIDRLYSKAVELLTPATKREALASLDLFWARLAVHIRAEHRHLFPAVAGLKRHHPASGVCEGIDRTIEGLRHDHDHFMHELAGAMKELRAAQAAGADSAAIVESVRTRVTNVGDWLAEHNRIEEKKIYALDHILSSGTDGGDLAETINAELANLPHRFRSDGHIAP